MIWHTLPLTDFFPCFIGTCALHDRHFTAPFAQEFLSKNWPRGKWQLGPSTYGGACGGEIRVIQNVFFFSVRWLNIICMILFMVQRSGTLTSWEKKKVVCLPPIVYDPFKHHPNGGFIAKNSEASTIYFYLWGHNQSKSEGFLIFLAIRSLRILKHLREMMWEERRLRFNEAETCYQ